MTIPSFLKSQKSLTGIYLHLSIGLGLCSGFLVILQAWLMAKTINAVMFEQAGLSDVKNWLILLLVLFIFRATLTWASEVSAFKAAAQVKQSLRAQLQEKIFALGPIRVADQHSGEIANTLVEGIEALENYYARYLPTMSLVALVPLSILIFIFPIDWISGVVLLVTAPLIPFFMILIGKGTEKLNHKQWRKLARMSAHFLDMIQGISTLKLFNASKREANTIAMISDEYRKTTMSVLRVAFLSSLALEFLATVSIAIVAVLIGFRLFYGEMDFFYGFFALLLAPEFYLPLRNMGTHYHARLEAIGAAENILKILEKSNPQQLENTTKTANNLAEINQAEINQSENKTNNSETIAIELQHIHFAYPNRSKALDDFSLRIPAAKRTAIVGYSGAGKSTVANLLLGFIQPQAGKILINQQNLNQIGLEKWREKIAWVPQRPHFFHGSIHDNITLGNTIASEQQIKQAAKLAHIDHLIENLADGYHTLIGDKGAGISGGEAQRIALARAFLKDAPVVILDEATANLDTNNEQLIQKSINTLAQNRTLIIIAHRLKTIESADHIVVMDKGKIVEAGTHQQLLENQSHYQDFLKTLESHQGDSNE